MNLETNAVKLRFGIFRGGRNARWTFLLLMSLVSCSRQAPANRPSTGGKAAESATALQLLPSSPAVLFDAPEFTLTDQNGKPFGTSDLRGRAWVVNFMFTRCTATCPRQTEKLAELQRHVLRWPDAERVQLVSITVDPKHDTAARLREYAASHHADPALWKFLTGERAGLYRISKDGFKLAASDAAADSSTLITHSSRFVLVDSQMRIRGFYDGLDDKELSKLRGDLRSVLSEPSAEWTGPIHVGIPDDVFDPPWLDERRTRQLASAGELGARHDFHFVDRLDASGIRFVNQVVADAAQELKPNHYDHGVGLAVADVDGDGLCDLYFVSQVGGNELWRNLGGGRFENITDEAGVALAGRVSVSASFADTDNDGDSDLFVTTTRHGNALFENDGRGRFRDISAAAGLDYVGHSSSADFFDYDRDGLLDLFVTNVGAFTSDEIGYSGDRERDHPYYVGIREAFAAHLIPERSERSTLYHNEGGNSFRDVSEETGLVHRGWSGDATPLDANGDGWVDLYVVNMQGNDEYYENIEGRRFERRTDEVFGKSPWGAMGVKSFDFNNDGRMDLFVTNMHADMWKPLPVGGDEKSKARGAPKEYLQSRTPNSNVFGNAFYKNQGNGRYVEISDQINAETYWPWGLSVGDLNADGFQDAFITSSMNMPYRYHVNSLLLNDQGVKFRDAEFILGVEPRCGGKTATPWFELDCSGADAGRKLCEGRRERVIVWAAIGSRSSAIVDLDQDGDLDIVTNDFNSPPMLLVSSLSEQNAGLRYTTIRLRGTRSNRDALGAKVQVAAGGRVFTQVHDGQSGYLSQSAVPLYFGLGAAEAIDKIDIEWPSGIRQTVAGPIEANQRLVIVEEGESPGDSD